MHLLKPTGTEGPKPRLHVPEAPGPRLYVPDDETPPSHRKRLGARIIKTPPPDDDDEPLPFLEDVRGPNGELLPREIDRIYGLRLKHSKRYDRKWGEEHGAS
jgi:hypothetical protein